MESNLDGRDAVVMAPDKLARAENHGATRSHFQAQSVRPKEAASLLGIGTATLWRWVRDRPDMVRPIRLSPRCTVFPLDQLIAWRDAQGAKAAQ